MNAATKKNKPQEATAKHTLLVCMNDKQHTETALRFACARAKRTNATVEMLCVIDPVDYNTLFSVGDMIREDRKAAARKRMRELATQMEQEYGMQPELQLHVGNIVEEIVRTVGENKTISMIIMGVATDGSSAKSGLLQQMVQSLGHEYLIPLLMVPGNLTNDQITALA